MRKPMNNNFKHNKLLIILIRNQRKEFFLGNM